MSLSKFASQFSYACICLPRIKPDLKVLNKLMIGLHNKLCSARSSQQDVKFGGFNILFLGDSLQLPSVSPYQLYLTAPVN
jgi:hypothetical protein